MDWRHLAAGAVLAAGLLAGCAGTPAAPGVAGLRLLGEQRIAHRRDFGGTVVGGLSSIDYDPRSNRWIMASDDRSEFGPARFYAAHLALDTAGFHAVTLDAVHLFRQADGSVYPSAATARQAGGEVPDIEAVRFDPLDGSIWYASEGNGPLHADPFVRHAHADGACRATLPMPDLFNSRPDRASGPRANLGFEGLAFAADHQSLWLSMEAPLFQDGALADGAHGAVTRFTRVDRAGNMLAQYAYPLDPVQAEAAPGRFSDNGVADILAIDAHQLLVLERSGVQDGARVFHFYIRLYVADLDAASDIRTVPALAGAVYRPLRKRLLLNLNMIGLVQVDNLEGMAWGPVLPNGRCSLLLVSDDNFSVDQVTQLLAFDFPAREPGGAPYLCSKNAVKQAPLTPASP